MLATFALAGCRLPPPPDPNDPNGDTVMQIDVLRRNLSWASQAVNERVAKGEITDEQGKELLAESAQRLLAGVKIDKINPVEAWEYGDVFRTAKDWKLAFAAYTVAVGQAEKSKNEDRRVNDTLRLAEAEANLGKLVEAVETARKTFNAKPQGKAPILLGVLYEIVPGGEGKGKDAELAKLLEEAISQHEAVVVNSESESGRAFLMARPHHLIKAWGKVVDLYRAAGLQQEAEAAAERGSKRLVTHERV